MKIIKKISVEMTFYGDEFQTLSNVCELTRRNLETRESNYIAEFGEDEAKNIREFIADVFAI